MPVVSVPTAEIRDWSTFHEVFARTLGFPSYYGNNMDAWIDCLTYADDTEAEMIATENLAGPGDVLTLQVEDSAAFAARCPEQYEALIECAAFVNWRRIDVGERPIVALSFFKSAVPAAPEG
jgi:hypothetical protein